MYSEATILRLTGIVALISICCAEDLNILQKKIPNGKYPLQVHSMFVEQMSKKRSKLMGVWSAWSSWSQCSRSCGGGVMVQTRHCINRPKENRFIINRRRRRQNFNFNGCVGLYKRIHLCNRQECPIERDFRYEQCSAYNSRSFKGRRYTWEPFLQGVDQCALNCRPHGMDFYATLNRTVIDGTPCRTSGRMISGGTAGVCVDGHCKAFSTEGVVGNIDESRNECPACTNGTCRTVSGIYTRADLQPGYTYITIIPQGACKIFVQQLKHSRNFIALKNLNGSYVVNGDWQIAHHSHTIQNSGTRFNYVKQDGTSLETITSPGPSTNPLEIYIVIYKPNLGIKYGYSIPNDEITRRQLAPPLLRKPAPETNRGARRSGFPGSQQDEAVRPHHRQRRLRRRYTWKISGISACSKSCGGGFQTTVTSCVRELTLATVLDKRCAHLERPKISTTKCNMQKCPPTWDGYWGQCSVSCGEGIQRYIIQCKEDTNSVNEVLCSGRDKPFAKTQVCSQPPCDLNDNELSQTVQLKNWKNDWTTSPWSECSVSCGSGHRTRSVTCSNAGLCHIEDRPDQASYCDMPPCPVQTPGEISPWLVTEWSKCSEQCGTGSQKRYSLCSRDTCDISSKPESSRDCSSDKQCGGQWYVGPWEECTSSCQDRAHQTRQVLCVVKIRGISHITNDMTCPNHLKPYEEQACNGKCEATWFMGSWRPCEGCPNGVQRRELRCMDPNGGQSNKCNDKERPAASQSCHCPRKDNREKYKPIQDQPIDRSCEDKIPNCHLAVRARLCQYPYYIKQCCMSCRNGQNERRIE